METNLKKLIEMTNISDRAIEAVRGNNRAMGRFVADFDKHYKTIENWLKGKNIILTTPKAVDIIKAETGLTEEEIFETEKTNA